MGVRKAIVKWAVMAITFTMISPVGGSLQKDAGEEADCAFPIYDYSDDLAVAYPPDNYLTTTEIGPSSVLECGEPRAVASPRPGLGSETLNASYEIDLTGHVAGDWVFVSFAYVMDGNIDYILNDTHTGDGQTDWDIAMWYDPLDATDPWKTYRVGGTNNDLTTIDHTMGIWLHLTANNGDQYLSTGLAGDYSPLPVEICLYEGWNMVGYPSGTPVIASYTLPPQVDRVAVWQAASPYVNDIAELNTVTMSEGNAYWVHVNSDCLWTVSNLSQPFLTLLKTAPSTANPGENIGYIISCSNLGVGAAYDIMITDVYPAGVTFIASVPAPTIGNNIWIFPALAPGITYDIYITVAISTGASGTLTNTAQAQYEDELGVPQAPVSDSALTIITSPVMQLTKSAPMTAQPGETINYLLEYENTGSDWACNVGVTEYYPPETVFVSSLPMPSVSNNFWLIGDIPPGAAGTIMVTVMLPSALEEGTWVNNSASLEYENYIGIGDIVWAYASTLIQTPLPGPVHNLDTGEYFDTILEAITDNDTLEGHTIEVSAGTYTEDIDFSKFLTIRGAGMGVTILTGGSFIISGRGTDISGFTFRNNNLALRASCCLIHNVTSENNTYGLYMDFPVHSTIRDCIFRNNSMGIWEYHSYACTIRNNKFENNTGFAIKLNGGEGEARDFFIFYNQFWFNNGATGTYDSDHIQALDSLDPSTGYKNYWDDGIGHGNYWYDWTTPDTNIDGIVDTPYTVDGWRGSQDRYPLTSPIAPEEEYPMIDLAIPGDDITQVSIYFGNYSIHFDSPMNTSVGSVSTNIPGTAWSWSTDGRWYNTTYGTLSYTELYYVDLTGRGFTGLDGKSLAGDTYLNFVTSYPPPPWAIATGPNATSSNPRPTITYIFGNSPSYVQIYYKKLNTSSWTTWGQDNTVNGVWIPGSDLPGPGTYYWNVRARGLGSQEWFPIGDSYIEAGPYIYDPTTAPTILSTFPTDGQNNVSVTLGSYAIQFNEPMNTSVGSVLTNLPGALWSWSADGLWHNGTFASLSINTTYYVDLTGRGFRDLEGNILSGDTYKDFATEPTESIPPASNVEAITPYWYSSSNTTISTNAWDNESGVYRVALHFRFSPDGLNWTSWQLHDWDYAEPWEWTFNFTTCYGEGRYQFYSIAEDDFGNVEAAPAEADAFCGYDSTVPEHSDEYPSIGSFTNDPSPEMSITVKDPLSLVNSSTVRLYIKGFSVFYNLTPVQDGYRVWYQHLGSFSDGEVIVCRMNARDHAGNLLDFTWNFTVDLSAPQHDGENPAQDEVSGNATPVISINITDVQSGIDPGTIRFYAQGFSVLYELEAINNGYRASYWHETGFTPGTLVTCRIVAQDYSGNLLDYTWSFTIP